MRQLHCERPNCGPEEARKLPQPATLAAATTTAVMVVPSLRKRSARNRLRTLRVRNSPLLAPARSLPTELGPLVFVLIWPVFVCVCVCVCRRRHFIPNSSHRNHRARNYNNNNNDVCCWPITKWRSRSFARPARRRFHSRRRRRPTAASLRFAQLHHDSVVLVSVHKSSSGPLPAKVAFASIRPLSRSSSTHPTTADATSRRTVCDANAQGC